MGRGGRMLMALAAVLLVSACGSEVTGVVGSGAPAPSDEDAWVVVTYDLADGDPAMMQLLPTETAADDALQAAGAGHIDGNEVGQGTYDMYFVGSDAAQMWAVVEPVLAGAPVPWARAELRDSLEDPDPTVLTP